ncbi:MULTISPECIES: hypothetical protein [unclassified Burkholderia]|uniref:hypothetical protein n=1 Tax=unclassified Burkholderia TaxID=2613784 RepID=UPI00117F5C74|nr:MULTISPECIES: hypothetical protein [unclassified Burkholderia]MCA8061007.1 hypothetical protein [Burkholderia sp. AU38729]
MNTGIVIYGTDPTQAASALSMAENLFRQFGEEAAKAMFLEFVVRNGERFVEDHEISLAELKVKVLAGEAAAFQISNDGGAGGGLSISFGHNVPEFEGFSFVDVQISDSVYKVNKEVEVFLEEAVARVSFKYAIAYDAVNMTAAYKYSSGVNLTRIFPFENTSLFTKDLPGRVPGSASYEGVKLRMVYPLNVLNEQHLGIRVNDISLREWIGADPRRGSLKNISNKMWLWSVKESDLLEINNACGEAGILLAWQKTQANKPARKLP